MSDNLKGILFALTTALLWGFLAIALKVAVTKIDPFTIVWFRFALAFLVLLIYFSLLKKQALSILKKPPWPVFIAGFFLGINYFGFLMGINYTSPSNAQVVMQMGPIILALVGVLVYREKLNRRQIAGFILAGLGLFLFYREQISNLLGQQNIYDQGMIWIFLGASSWVIYATIQKFLVKNYAPQSLNMMLYLVPAILYIPMVEFGQFTHLSLNYWLLLIFLGLNTLIAYGALAEAFKYTEANKISIIITCNPIVTLLAMWVLEAFQVNWIAAEEISINALLSAILVLSGAVLAVLKPKKHQKNPHK
ncbi:MAG: DMT family transporter [Candidatus Cyclobacteriaceae bacterium M3_2C_046]